MKITAAFRSQFSFPGSTNLSKPKTNSTVVIPIKPISVPKNPSPRKTSESLAKKTPPDFKTKHLERPIIFELTSRDDDPSKRVCLQGPADGHSSRFLVFGAVSMGFVLFLMIIDSDKALALGPDGPLMEEFWDNVRRYALYALTVSTGALYTIFLPIVELLKNPVSAVLIILIFGGGLYIISQVISAMVGVSDFSYDYAY